MKKIIGYLTLAVLACLVFWLVVVAAGGVWAAAALVAAASLFVWLMVKAMDWAGL